jgi:hypothetical protein
MPPSLLLSSSSSSIFHGLPFILHPSGPPMLNLLAPPLISVLKEASYKAVF